MRERALCLLMTLASCATAAPNNGGDDDPRPDASTTDSGPVPDTSCQSKTWYRDVDQDMHGDPATAMMSCTQPVGMTATGDDCDDANPARHPGAAEICDGVDTDCNAGAEPCPSACSPVRRPVPDDAKVYLFCSGFTSWPTARQTCSNAGFQLVQIETASENAWVYQTALSRLGGEDIHIGGTDSGLEGAWMWEAGPQFWSGGSGGSPVGGRYANWEPGEPNDSGNEDCAEMRDFGEWNDDDCFDSQRYVCRR
jgi:hypothetical protein